MAEYLTDNLAIAILGDDFASLYSLPKQRTILDRDILSAETEVNSNLARYKLPLTDERAIDYITSLAASIFVFHAWGHAAGDELPSKIVEAAKAARKQLADIRSGAVTLAGGTPAASTEADATIVSAGNTPQFDRPNMEDY